MSMEGRSLDNPMRGVWSGSRAAEAFGQKQRATRDRPCDDQRVFDEDEKVRKGEREPTHSSDSLRSPGCTSKIRIQSASALQV
jgi:hypothetical protein